MYYHGHHNTSQRPRREHHLTASDPDFDAILLHAFSLNPPKSYKYAGHIRNLNRLHAIQRVFLRMGGKRLSLDQVYRASQRLGLGSCEDKHPRKTTRLLPLDTNSALTEVDFKTLPVAAESPQEAESPQPVNKAPAICPSDDQFELSSDLKTSAALSMTGRRLASNKPALQQRLLLSAPRFKHWDFHRDPSALPLVNEASQSSPITPINQVIHTPDAPPELSRLTSKKLATLPGQTPHANVNARNGSPLSPLCDLTNTLSLVDSPQPSTASIRRRLSYFNNRALSLLATNSSPGSHVPLHAKHSVLDSPLHLPYNSPLTTPLATHNHTSYLTID